MTAAADRLLARWTTDAGPSADDLVGELVWAIGLAASVPDRVPVAVPESAACVGALHALTGVPVSRTVAAVLSVAAAARAVGLPDVQRAIDDALRAAVEAHRAASTPLPLGATRDRLSGLLDAAAFLEAADRVIASGERSIPPALVLVMPTLAPASDDRLAADLAVKRFSAALRRCARADDLLGRLDDRTFAVLLPASDQQRGRHIGRRIVTRCAPWTPRVGVAWLAHPENARFLAAAADSALDRADAETPLVVSVRDDLVEAEVVGS